MAKDRIEVELLFRTQEAERKIKKINAELARMGKTLGGVGGGVGGDKTRALGTGLSKATVKADEFNKSLEASNARVIAFGASAGLIMGVNRAMKAMVTSTIKVEKTLLDINVVMGLTTKQLQKVSKGMFDVARNTGQGFDVVGEAMTEFARQGLTTEKTLQRTNDAMILVRLTGMNAADAVKSLTAAVNSFNKEGTTSAQIVNRMAKVDAAFAVSSEDLAKAIGRVGASAISAGVNMNELMAITTAVQQKTARGGAVIGNAFKTIFTRLQRKDVLQNLRNLGVAVTDFNGNALSGMQVLQNLSKEFTGLSKATQSATAEQVAGVFQVNILKAALSDLSGANSQYAQALRTANSATNEAYLRNEELSQSLDHLINDTLAGLTQAGAGLGGAVEPAIRKVLGLVNGITGAFQKGGSFEEFGKTWGRGMIKGLGDFIAGPGLIMVTAVFGKLAFSLAKFGSQALKDIIGINAATKQRAALEEIVVNTMAKEPGILSKVKAGALDVLGVERQILNTITAQQAQRQALSGYAGPLATSMYSRGMRVGRSGSAFNKGFPSFADPRRGSSGNVPNFSSLSTSIGREMSAGVPASSIRVGSSPALRSSGNPGGIGVYNTIDEPRGLNQGISRSRSMGINPKTHGIPNFSLIDLPGFAPAPTILGPTGAPYRPPTPMNLSSNAEFMKGFSGAASGADAAGAEMKRMAKEAGRLRWAMSGLVVQMAASGAASQMEEGSAGRFGLESTGRVAGYAGMGMMFGGPYGAAAGAVLGGVASGIDYLKNNTDEAENSVKSLSEELKKITENSNLVQQALNKVGDSIGKLGGESNQVKRVELVQDIVSSMVNAISNISNPQIKAQMQAQMDALDLSATSAQDLQKFRNTLLAESATQKEITAAQLMGTNMRQNFGTLDFLSNAAGKGNYGQMLGAGGLDMDTILNIIPGLLRLPGSTNPVDVGWQKNILHRKINARNYAPEFSRQLMGMPGIGGAEVGQLMMGDEATRVSLGNLQARFKAEQDRMVQTKEGGWNSKVAQGAFEPGGVMSEGLKAAGISTEIRAKIREALDTPEARNIVLRTLFGMEMSKIETPWTDWLQDLPAVDADPGAKFSPEQRALLDKPIGAKAVHHTSRRADDGIKAYDDLINSARQASYEMGELAKATARQVSHDKKIRAINSRYSIARAGVGMGDSRTVAEATKTVAIDEAKANFKSGNDKALNTLTASWTTFNKGLTEQFKTFAKNNKLFEGGYYSGGNVNVMGKTLDPTGGTGFKVSSKADFAREIFGALTTGNIDPDLLQTQIRQAQQRKEGGTGAVGLFDQVMLEFGPKVLEQSKSSMEAYNSSLTREKDLRDKAVIAAKSQNKVTLKTIELAGRYKRGMELQNQRLALSRASERLDYTEADFKSGRITGSQVAGFNTAQRTASRNYLGLTEGNTGANNVFRDQFLYGPRQALNDFEVGQREVAQSMKSSFADAFQSISSGASTVKGALANMAQGILNSISSISANMFSNMLFSSFGTPMPAKMAGGGMVTGGSGYKDDVPTLMQGGEFVIKKSAVNKIGLPALNAINSAPSYANGGQNPSMWKMGAVAAGAGALSGIIGAATAPGQPDPAPSRDYGMGRSNLGYLGGADPDSGQVDSISGGAGRGSVSLAKGYVYYRRDPQTGRLVSERARPTEGRFEVSNSLSLLGRLNEGDPQTSRMFGKEQTMARYQDYLITETQSRKDQINAVKKQKKQRLIGAWMNAAMLIGGAKLFGGGAGADSAAAVPGATQTADYVGSTGMPNWATADQMKIDNDIANMTGATSYYPANGGRIPTYAGGGNTGGNGGLAKVMGGEYIMSPQAVRTHGVGFMTELNRGSVPGYASGGLVGGGSGGGSTLNTGGNMTNNVKINVNIDKSGKADVQSSASSDTSGPSEERGDQQEAQNNAEFSELLSNMVVEEIVKQQRPGGLLQQGKTSF